MQFIRSTILNLTVIFAGLALYASPSRADFFESPRERFVKENPCPNNKTDCYFEYRHPNPRNPVLGVTEFIRAESAVSNDGGVNYRMRYKSLDDPNCRVRSCTRLIPARQVHGIASTAGMLLSVVTMGLYETGADLDTCSVCRTTGSTEGGYHITIPLPPARPAPAPEAPLEMPNYSLTRARNTLVSELNSDGEPILEGLKLDCYGHDFLEASIPALNQAQGVYDIPAASIACLISQESKWHPDARSNPEAPIRDQFAGLAQCNQDAMDTMIRRLSPNNGSYDESLRAKWSRMMPGVDPSRAITRSSFYRAGSGGNPPNLNAAERLRMGRTAVTFVASFLRKAMELRLETIRTRYGAQVANALNGSPALLAMAYISYNAGLNVSDDFVPAAFYRRKDFSVSSFMRSIVQPRGISNDKMSEVRNYVTKINGCESAPTMRPLRLPALERRCE